MSIIELNKDNIQSTIDDNDLVLIDFWAPWCGPCKAFGPVFEATSQKYDDVVFAKCNTDEEQELAGKFGITGIPTLIAFREKIGVFRQAGMLPASELERLIKEIKSMDMDDVRKKIEAQEKSKA